MDARLREERLEFCRLVAKWYLNNQCTESNPWATPNGADLGRFIYQYYPSDKEWRGMSVWGHATGSMALMAAADRFEHKVPGAEISPPSRDAAVAATAYMMSLQILDQRNPSFFGAFRQSTPQSVNGNPRDGATGAMGLCEMYKRTREEEYLYRAKLFGDWYISAAMGEDKWPCYTYYFNERGGDFRKPGLWQAGAGLAFYYLYKLTGEKRYIEEGLRPLMDRVKQDFEPSNPSGNDDFAATTAMGACMAYDDPELTEWVREQMASSVAAQEPDGAVRGLDGTPVLGMNCLNFIEFIEAKGLSDDPEPYRAAVEKAAQFVPTLQERCPDDLRAYGGIYGQTSYGVSRHLIHHRPAAYSLLFMLRAEGEAEVSGYNVFGW